MLAPSSSAIIAHLSDLVRHGDACMLTTVCLPPCSSSPLQALAPSSPSHIVHLAHLVQHGDACMRRCISAAGCAGEAARAVALAAAAADEAALKAGEADAFEKAAKWLLDAAASANTPCADEAVAAIAVAGARCRTASAAALDSERETLGRSSTMAAGSRLELSLSCAEELLAGIALRRLKHVRHG